MWRSTQCLPVLCRTSQVVAQAPTTMAMRMMASSAGVAVTITYPRTATTSAATATTMMNSQSQCVSHRYTSSTTVTTAFPIYNLVSQRRFHGTAEVNPNDSTLVRYAKMGWEGLRHIYHGFRLFFFNTRLAWKYSQRLKQGVALTRRERVLLERATGDLLRLVPFSLFLIIPFAEFLLPVALKMFPELIPSTFETDAQGRSKAFQSARARKQARKRMLEHMTTQVLGKFPEYGDIVRRASCGDPVRKEHVKAIAPMCTKDGFLGINRIPFDVLCDLAKYVGVYRPYYAIMPKSISAPRIRTALLAHYRTLRQDDQLLRNEGVSDLSHDELMKANLARGMRWTESDDALLQQLEWWLDIGQDPKIPYNTLFWIKPTANSLRKTMLHLTVESRRDLLGISNLPESVRESLERVVDQVSQQRETPATSTTFDADAIAEAVTKQKEAAKAAGDELDEAEVVQNIAAHLTEDAIADLFKEIEAVHGKVRVSEVIEYLATDIHYSSHVVSNVFDALDMPSGSALMTPSMLRSVAARCRVKSAPKAKPTPAASSASKRDGSK